MNKYARKLALTRTSTRTHTHYTYSHNILTHTHAHKCMYIFIHTHTHLYLQGSLGSCVHLPVPSYALSMCVCDEAFLPPRDARATRRRGRRASLPMASAALGNPPVPSPSLAGQGRALDRDSLDLSPASRPSARSKALHQDDFGRDSTHRTVPWPLGP